MPVLPERCCGARVMTSSKKKHHPQPGRHPTADAEGDAAAVTDRISSTPPESRSSAVSRCSMIVGLGMVLVGVTPGIAGGWGKLLPDAPGAIIIAGSFAAFVENHPNARICVAVDEPTTLVPAVDVSAGSPGLLLEEGEPSDRGECVMRLASFNAENLLSPGPRPWTPPIRPEGEPALKAYDTSTPSRPSLCTPTRTSPTCRLQILLTRYPGEHPGRKVRLNPKPFEAWALLRENRGDFLVAPTDAVNRGSRQRAGRGHPGGWS